MVESINSWPDDFGRRHVKQRVLRLFAVPAGDLRDDDDDFACRQCGKLFDDAESTYHLESEAAHCCETCVTSLYETLVDEAESYALENCKLTRRRGEIDCDYRASKRWRHGTNYRELVGRLSSDDLRDVLFACAIEDRFEDLLDEEALDDSLAPIILRLRFGPGE